MKLEGLQEIHKEKERSESEISAADISQLSVHCKDQAPRTLDPTFPTMRLNDIFHYTFPVCLFPTSFKL